MKRWQDRGEVQDSDDEENSLERESQTTKTGRKKPRLSDDERDNVDRRDGLSGNAFATDDLEDGDKAEDWIGPRIATPYSRKAKPLSAPTLSEDIHERENRAASPMVIPTSPIQHPAETRGPIADLRSSPSEKSENLPSLQEIFTARTRGADAPAAGEDYDSSSALSSPLSEREISPPAPFFQFPRLQRIIGTGSSSDNEDVSDLPSQDDIEACVASSAPGRRSLRARQEKQLHPYMFDKAQYQRQCRERGLRPVRLMDASQRAAETQDTYSSDRESNSSQPLHQNHSDILRASSELEDEPLSGQVGPSTLPLDSDEELPELHPSLHRPIFGAANRGVKRQKLDHVVRVTKSTAAEELMNHGFSQLQDDFSIPPSPPPTSSDSAGAMPSRTAAPGFRMPRGLTPAPLPTPQISSDSRPLQRGAEDVLSDVGLSTRRSRPLARTHSRNHNAVATDSSSESSEAELEPELEQSRMQREAKRIRGVLPASWLKIDLRTRQNESSPSARRARQESHSPPRTMPQKGVAQKVKSRRYGSPTKSNTITISDDEDESDHSRPLNSPTKRQTKLQFDRQRGTVAQSDFVDIDSMEVDYVDSMLAGSAYKSSKTKGRNTRQPRIMDAFVNIRRQREDFSEEQRAFRQATGNAKARMKRSHGKSRVSASKKSTAPRLSIVDAVTSPSISCEKQPLFVRLAVRQAKTQPERARHSPTHKHIRLATGADTADALSTFRAWREGTILPRLQTAQKHDHGVVDFTNETDQNLIAGAKTCSREPLSELSPNKQQRLPGAIPRRPKDHSRNRTSNHALKQPRIRQSRLETIEFPDRPTPDAQKPSRLGPPGAHKKKRPPHNVQSRHVRYHAAQLESLETEFDRDHRATAFERTMNRLTRHIPMAQSRNTVTDFQMARFLNDPDPKRSPKPRSNANTNQTVGKQYDQNSDVTQVLPHRPRKRQPRHLDADAREFRQPSEPLPDIVNDEQIETETAPIGEVLQGLGRFGTRYATDFDILPISIGTYFHATSFIGSGDFAASLDFGGRNLDVATGLVRIHLDGDLLEWGGWSEDVASGLDRIPGAVSDAFRDFGSGNGAAPDSASKAVVLSNIDYLLRSTVRYFARCVAFLDAVDRRQCVQALHRFTEDLLDLVAEHESENTSDYNIFARVSQYALVVAKQASCLCDHPLVTTDTRNRGKDLVSRAAHRLANQLFPHAFQALRSFYENNRHASKREAGVRDDETAICGLVLLRHAMQDAEGIREPFWSVVNEFMCVDVTKLNNVNDLDKVWFNLLTIQPSLEIDTNGILRPGGRLEGVKEDWSLVKQLVDRVFNLYHPTTSEYGATVNDYVRAILSRCHLLMSRWGWWRCESILGTVFDFFARRGLAQLYNEESRGSPNFLGDLTGSPSLEVHIEDRSFHIFLKMLASGLQGMSKHHIYSPKKIGGIAWRFIPNHGRTHRKDSELQRDDLDALRNHHDLLCTLYYSSPPCNRPSVQLLRNLVDHAASHVEACRLNVRAWAYLASFQTSTSEGDDCLEPFIAWFQDVLITTIDQYRLARTEVEQEVSSADAQGKPSVSRDVIENTIARNQRNIAATLVDMLSALKRAVKSACSHSSAAFLLEGSTFWQVFDLFEPSSRRLQGMLEEAIEVISTAVEVQCKDSDRAESQSMSEDSQDYGDTSALHELASTQAAIPDHKRSIAEIVHMHVGHLVSNVFGADSVADDSILTKIVDVWTQVAHVMVRNEKRTWTSYIGDYSADSWNQLRDTAQRRKFTSYFLARVLELSNIDLTETDILASWLKTVVEREAVLKFQHALTNALLNRVSDQPLLFNLPFSRDAQGIYNISLPELRQRRLALLSTILSNMRESVDSAIRNRLHNISEVRRRYGDILRQVMYTMKNNYQELLSSHGAEVADGRAQGGYVDFVQQVVSFLQQYTTDICPIDRFFTDSAVFPLPATDPTYVTGRLRSYMPKLSESGKRKELAVFIQTVSERAAVDGQQPYLVNQLVSAMALTFERGDSRAPSLRHVLCTAIFPAYIEAAFSTPCSWIVAIPILEAFGKIAEQILYTVKLEDEDSVQAVTDTLLAVLQSMMRPITVALMHPGLLSLPHIQRILSTIFQAVRQCLPGASHLARVAQIAEPLVRCLTRFRRYVAAIDAQLELSNNEDADELDCLGEQIHLNWSDTQEYAFKQVREKFSKDWYAHDGQYFVKRGNTSVEVVMTLGEEEEERSHLINAIRKFCESFERIIGSQSRTMDAFRGAGSMVEVFV